MFVQNYMLVYCSPRKFLVSYFLSFFKSMIMIGKYIILIGFTKAHKYTFTKTM